jgi:hypothetical protein
MGSFHVPHPAKQCACPLQSLDTPKNLEGGGAGVSKGCQPPVHNCRNLWQLCERRYFFLGYRPISSA